MKNLLGALGMTLLLTTSAVADDANLWIQKAQLFSPETEYELTARLTIRDPGGDQRTRELRVSSRKDGDYSELLVEVTNPASVKGLKFLQRRGKTTPGTWLRTNRAVRRVSPGATPEPLFGSDFTTADLEPSLEGWSWKSRDEQTVVLERSTPDVEILVLRAKDGVVLRRETKSADGQARRVYEVLEWSGDRPSRARLTDLALGSQSELEILTFRAQALSPNLFVPGNL